MRCRNQERTYTDPNPQEHRVLWASKITIGDAELYKLVGIVCKWFCSVPFCFRSHKKNSHAIAINRHVISRDCAWNWGRHGCDNVGRIKPNSWQPCATWRHNPKKFPLGRCSGAHTTLVFITDEDCLHHEEDLTLGAMIALCNISSILIH